MTNPIRPRPEWRCSGCGQRHIEHSFHNGEFWCAAPSTFTRPTPATPEGPSFLGHLVETGGQTEFVPAGHEIVLMRGRGKVTPVYDGPQNVTATPEGLREAVEAAFNAGWNAHETGYGSDSDGRARAFGAFTVNPAIFNDDVLSDEDDAALQPQAQPK